MNSGKKDRVYFIKQAIAEYERKTTPEPVKRDYVQEATNKLLNESVLAQTQRRSGIQARNKFLTESKTWMLQECIYKVFSEALSSILNEEEYTLVSEDMKHAVVYNFISESGGTDRLLRDFYDKNIFLSEVSRFVNHYHNRVVNEVKKSDKGCCVDGSYKIPKDIEDDFYKELKDADFGDMSIQISTRVIDAIDKFVTDNAESMNNIKQILTTTKEQIAASRKSVGESLELSAKKKIASVKNNRIMNVFGVMMEQTAKAIMKDDKLREAFSENGNLNIAKVKAYCAVSYTMLETVNTAKMAYINEQYIKDMIESI